MGKCRAVFVDRDGVLNKIFPEGDTMRGPRELGEVALLPGVHEACRILQDGGRGFTVIGITNQPDVWRGQLSFAQAEQISALVTRLACITGILACYHDDTANCHCRKPRPGLLWQAAAWWEIDLCRSFMVGDRDTDIEAGRRAGCRTIRISSKYGKADHITSSLMEAVPWIMEQD